MTKPISVLILEDSKEVLNICSMELDKIGHFPLPFLDGRKLIGEVENGLMYDVALIDRSSEDANENTDGDDVMKRLRQLHPEKPIISISCYADKPSYSNMHLTKPCGFDEILSSIERYGRD